MSYNITSRNTVTMLVRMLPADMKTLLLDSGITGSTVRDAMVLLVATKEVYVSGWRGVNPVFSVGNQPNVPRPTPAQILYLAEERRKAAGINRRDWYKAYREKNKDKMAAYTKANRERINAAKRARMAIRRSLDAGTLVVADESIKTVWRTA